MKKNLKPQIIALREKGYTYNQIEKELNCSKSTISFHIGEGQKEKFAIRRTKYRKDNVLAVKINRFINTAEPKPEYIRPSVLPPEERLSVKNPCRQKIKDFMRQTDENGKLLRTIDKISFTPKDIEEKSGSICYLTGRGVDLNNSKTYSLDHIKARSTGGENTLENCGVVCMAANIAKSNLSLEEFFQLCVDVVRHNKLDVSDKSQDDVKPA